MKSETDVIIVGAGFAGLSAAESCARRGIDCLVLEKSSEISYPIHTSGGSWIDELKKLGIPSSLYHPIKRCRFISPNNEVVFEYDKPVACVIDVRGLLQFLAERALDAGAEIRVKSIVKNAIFEENYVKGVIANVQGREKQIKSKIVIDTSGFASIIAKKLGLHNGFKRFGIGAEYDLYAPRYDQDEAILIVGSKLAPSGYGWAFPHGNNRVRVGVGIIYPHVKANPKNYLDMLIKHLSKFGLDSAKQIEFHFGATPSQEPLKKTVTNGLIIAGDAAGQSLQLVGEGIRISMQIGKIAGEVAASAILAGDYSEKYLIRYEKLWRSKFERKIKISFLINKRIVEYDDEKWDESVEIFKKLSSEQLYKILKCDFSKSLIFDIVKKNPSLIKSTMMSFLLGGIS